MPSKQELKTAIDHLRELVDMRDTLREEAVKLALNSIDNRLGGMNEFRAQQQDTIARFATLEKLGAEIDKVNIRIDVLFKEQDALKQWKSNKQGRDTIIQYLYPIGLTLLGYLANKYIH